ncbi:hypothetical protein Droror1_Dr00020393, partial [Drosera rotundifolia]
LSLYVVNCHPIAKFIRAVSCLCYSADNFDVDRACLAIRNQADLLFILFWDFNAIQS